MLREILQAARDSLSSSHLSEEEGEDVKAWERDGGFILYLFLVVYIVLSFEILVNDFFIPALNVLCTKCGISQDFAGATLMPAGSEIPDILISTFGMLILHSDVGVGTVAGSMLFNILVIVGGCIIAVNTLLVDTAVVLRDIAFFFLSLLLLLISAINGEVTTWEAITFIVLYGFYITVCYNMENFKLALSLFRRKVLGKADVPVEVSDRLDEDLLGHGEVAIASSEDQEMNVGDITVTVQGDKPKQEGAAEEGESDDAEKDDNSITGPVKGRSANTAKRLQMMAFKEQQLSKPMDEGNQTTMGLIGVNARICGTLYKRCIFYKLALASRAWQTRYFVLDENFWYCRNPLHAKEKSRIVPLWAATSIERDKKNPAIFHVVTPQQTYTFRAETSSDAQNWLEALRERLLYIHAEVDPRSGKVYVPNIPPSATVDSAEDEEESSLLEPPPSDASMGSKFMWYLTYPYSFAFTYTIPNVKKPRWKNWYPLTFFLVCVWLAGLVYAMVWFADRTAVVLGLPADIMGIAFTGICASLPCLFGSLVCARQGAGGMAIANAIASNTACILLGFGLPFFIQTVIVTPGQPMGIDSESIPLTVIVLMAALAVFLVGAIVCCMRLKRAVGIVYVIAFIILLAVIIGLNAAGVSFQF